jgi:hypothetical protein
VDAAGRFVVTTPEGAEDVLGLWQAEAAPVSFAGGPGAGALRWMVDLPTNYRAAAAAVQARAALLRRQRRALEVDAPRRFVAAVRAAGWAAGAAPEPASGRVAPVETEAGAPERDLVTSLRALGATDAAGGALRHSPGGAAPDHVQGLVEEAQAFVEQVSRATTSYAWVETRQEGTLLARTAVRWLGGVTTEARAGLDGQRVALHRDAVALAVESRTAWLRAFLLAAQGAAIVATAVGALSTPAGALLVLPAAVRFLRQVLAETRQRQ